MLFVLLALACTPPPLPVPVPVPVVPGPGVAIWPDSSAALRHPVIEVPPGHRPQKVFVSAGHGAPGNEGNLGSWCAREQDFKDDRLYAYLLGNALLRRNEILRGQAFIDRLFRDGESAEASLLLGVAHLRRGDNRAAVPELEKAIRLNPELA